MTIKISDIIYMVQHHMTMSNIEKAGPITLSHMPSGVESTVTEVEQLELNRGVLINDGWVLNHSSYVKIWRTGPSRDLLNVLICFYLEINDDASQCICHKVLKGNLYVQRYPQLMGSD